MSDYGELIGSIQKERLAGRRFQREGHGKFRDCVTAYLDGRLLFERFCYGEAAGLVFSMWADRADEGGTIRWNLESCAHSAKGEAPKKITGFAGEKLYFDGKQEAWLAIAALKTDPKNGYNLFRKMFSKKSVS